MNENVLVFAGIIVGVAVADQLTNLHRLLRQRDRVRWDWLLLWLAAAVLVTQIQVWWSLAGQSEGSLTIGSFLPNVVTLILLFLLSSASLPDVGENVGTDLRAYYDEQSRYVWSLYALTLGWLIVSQFVERATRGTLAQYNWLPEVLVLALMASLVLVRKRWWHAIGLAVLTVTGPLNWLSRSLS